MAGVFARVIGVFRLSLVLAAFSAGLGSVCVLLWLSLVSPLFLSGCRCDGRVFDVSQFPSRRGALVGGFLTVFSALTFITITIIVLVLLS